MLATGPFLYEFAGNFGLKVVRILKLGCSSYSFSNMDLSQILNWLNLAGINWVDIGSPSFNLWDRKSWKKIKYLCREYSVKPCMLTINGENLWAPAPSTTSDGLFELNTFRRAIDAAASIGSYRIGLVVNQLPSGQDKKETFLGLTTSLNQVKNYCHKKGVNIFIEVHVRGPLTTLKEAIDLKEKVLSPNVGFTLDTSLLAYQRIDFVEACESLKDWPLNVHIRDITDHDFFGIPGRGRVNFKYCLKGLYDIKYNDPLIIELFKTKENYNISLQEAILDTKILMEETWSEIEK